uniref:Uncharacterized protein n=1 Tax=Timema cristinae TaxID=61476 RepID=A0A7R9GQP5_TIMCR|nr:unnamed protein product [Timema cristinae]
MDSWSDSLVRWANSLDIIHSPLKSIQEIKDNAYFVPDLLAIINPESNDGNPPPKPAKEAWTNFVELLQSNYPYCDVAGLCTEENEVYLFTLLMHYVCVLVKHPDLLKNILKNLPPEDHACVAHVLMYLQDGEKKITSEVLRLAVTKSFKDPKDKLVHLKSSSATLSRQASPLGMQFSRTSPISRVSAQSPGQSIKVLSDKNREIKRLKSDLESEISENVRLQEQLKIEKDRNKELAHKLDGKTTEIKRLREDYLATEDFPSSDKGDAKVVEKRYKSEVKCLEEYVASLHVDIEKLQVEKEEVAIKLATFEHHTSMWCEKAMRYEEMCLKLEEELQQSTMELDGFRSHCSELEEIIQNLRPKHISIECDSPLRLNTTTSTSVSLSENMGEVFVDLLLREKEEENARLMDDINLIKTEKQELECDLKKLKSELDNFYTQRQSLEAANKVLLLKNQKHCINIFILNEKIQCLRENIVKITILKETTKTELEKTKCQLEEMVSLRDILLTKNDIITKQANDNIEHLSLEKETLKQAYTASTKEYERNLGSLTHNMNVLKQQLMRIEGEKAVLEVCNTKLSEDKVKLQQTIHTHEGNELSLRKNIDSLNEIRVCLENTKSDLEIKNVQLLETIDACENKSSSFQNEIYKLESVQAQQGIELGHLIEEQKSHLLEIESLRNSLEDLTTSKEMLEETVEHLTLSNEETVIKWTSHAFGLETKVSELDEQLNVMKTYLASLQSELVEVNNIKASLEDEYNSAIVKYKRDTDSLNEEVYLIKHNLSISQENKATLEHTNRNLSKEIEILQKLNDSLERDNINLQSNVNELELTNKQCQSKINHLVEENNEQIVKLEKLGINLNDAFKKINDHEAVISDLACSNKQEIDSWIIQISSLEANIILFKDEIQKVQTELAKTMNEKLSLEKTFSIASKESEENISALNKQINALNNKILSLEEIKKTMEEKETKLFCDIKSKEESLNYYINEIECLKSDIHELELVKNKQRLEIDRLFEEKNSNVAKIQQLRVSLSAVSQEKYDLQTVINQMNLSSVSSMENWTSRTASMGKRIEEMQKEIYNLTQKLECAQIKLEEESTCKAELQQSHISCTQQFEYNLVSLKQAMTVLEQTLSNTDAEKVVLQKQNKELEEENAKLRETIIQANEESIKLNYSVNELKSAHCVQIAELEKKQSLIAQLEITNTKLEASINLFKNKSQESFSLMKHEMEDRINTLKEEKESISKDAAKQIQEQLLEKDAVIENLKTKSINLDLVIEKLKLENSSHCNSLVNINASLLEERTKKDALLQEIACVKDSNTKLLNRINTLEEENAKHRFNIGTLEKHIKDEKESKEQITYKFDGDIKLAYERNSEMQAEISRFAQEIKVLKEEETSLKEKVSELESKNKNLAQLFEEFYKIWNVERQITEKLNILSVSCDLKEELDKFFSSYNSIKLKCKNILSQKSTSIAETKKIHTFLTELADISTRLEENTIAPAIMFEIKLTNASWALEKLGHICNMMEVRAESTDHSSYLQDDISEHTIAMKEKIDIVQLKISNLKGELVIGEEKCKMLASLLTNIAKTTSDRHASSINMEIEDNGWDPDDSLEMAVASKSRSIDHIENQDKLGEVNTVSICNFTRLKELNSNYEKKLNEMRDLVSVYFEQKEAALKNLDDLKKIAVPKAAYDKCMAENRDLRIKVMELKNKLIFVEKQSTDTQTMKQFIEERVRHEFEEKLDRAKQEMTKLMNEELKKKKQLAIMEKASNEQVGRHNQLALEYHEGLQKRYEMLKKECVRLRNECEHLRGAMKYKEMSLGHSSRSSEDLSDRRKYPSREYNQNMEVIDEFAVTLSRRRSSISSSTVPTGMGSMMLMEEEDEDEVFNSKHLEDLKAGRCEPHGEQSNKRRLTELQVRNSLCLPHLKSSYPAETQFHLTRDLKEDDIKIVLRPYLGAYSLGEPGMVRLRLFGVK